MTPSPSAAPRKMWRGIISLLANSFSRKKRKGVIFGAQPLGDENAFSCRCFRRSLKLQVLPHLCPRAFFFFCHADEFEVQGSTRSVTVSSVKSKETMPSPDISVYKRPAISVFTQDLCLIHLDEWIFHFCHSHHHHQLPSFIFFFPGLKILPRGEAHLRMFEVVN